MKHKRRFTNLQAVQTTVEKMPLVGFTVFWRLAGIRVSHDQLWDALNQANLIEFLPKPPTPRIALRRALERWIGDRKRQLNGLQRAMEDEQDESLAGNEAQRTLIRVINRAGNEHLVFALVAENIDFAALGLSYGTSLRILLHKKTGAMIVTTEAEGRIDAQHESQRLAAELAPYWDEYRDLHIACDLSEMMRTIIASLHATSLRQAGGVYFVPVTERAPLNRLQTMVDALPRIPEIDPFVCALGIPDAKETKKGLAQAVHAGMLDELAGLRADLEQLSTSGGKVREQTIAQRFIGFRRMRAKAELYRDLLDMQQEQVRAAIGELEGEARKLLGVDDPKPVSFALSVTQATTLFPLSAAA